jgi:hypothetical protein
MRAITVLLMCLLGDFGCAGAVLQAQTPRAKTGSGDAPVFALQPIRQLRKGVDAWPLILNANDAASKRVNQTLEEMNQELTSALKECDTNYLAWAKDTGDASAGKGVADDWERKVAVTMAGPRFVSVIATDDFFCGGAYPDSNRVVMVFDMSTGDLVDWTAMIAKSAGASPLADSGYDGTSVVALVLPALEKINLASVSPECKDAFDERQPFLIWPDAPKEQLVAVAYGLPHVVAACAEEVHLTMEQARALGFDEILIDSIKLAHGVSAATPKH